MDEIKKNHIFKTIGVLLLIVLGSIGLFFGLGTIMNYAGDWYASEDETFYTSNACESIIGSEVFALDWKNVDVIDLIEDPEVVEETLGENYAISVSEVSNGKETEVYDNITNDVTAIQSYGISYQKDSEPILDFGVSESEDYKYILKVGVHDPLVNDGSAIYQQYEMYNLFKPIAGVSPFITIVCVIGILVILIYETCAKGHVKNEEGIHLTWFDKIPFDVLLVILIPIMYFFATGFQSIVNSSNYKRMIILMIPTIITLCLILYAYYISFVGRIKAHTLIKNNVGVIILMFMYRHIQDFFRNFKQTFHESSKTFKVVTVFLMLAGIIEVLLLINLNVYIGSFFYLVLWLLLIAESAGLGIMIKMEVDSKVLLNAAQNLADGNLDERIPQEKLDKLNGDFYQHGKNLNSIGEGMQKAIQNELKSERMKAELITNVSHDIKTPLTSIINYVDLLSKEEDSTKQKEYIEVIQRQSQRLKKLTEDVVEASKATSGNIQVNMETVSVNEILEQALAEYQERMDEKNLEIIKSVPDTSIKVEADGRLLWRVLRNLFSNVSKYSKEGTRVYIDVKQELGNVSITVKNTSNEALNITEEELMQRFVRGDASRHTEGSGLGLSIAESLTELMGGSFHINIDGDLFKSIVVLNGHNNMNGMRQKILMGKASEKYKFDVFVKCKDEQTKEQVLKDVKEIGMWTSVTNLAFRGFCLYGVGELRDILKEKGYSKEDAMVLDANISNLHFGAFY